MTYIATIRTNARPITLEIRGALGPIDARRIACETCGAMPWTVSIEESRT